MPVDIRRFPLEGKDRSCKQQQHDLFRAAYCGNSRDNTQVYLLCYCGQQRVLRMADWDRLEEHRELSTTHEALENDR